MFVPRADWLHDFRESVLSAASCSPDNRRCQKQAP